MTPAGDGGRPRSIGEVLDLLKDEFPDITISKIRFLEGQGLLDIERTPSGYRKFHDADIARLRWILRQQREHFLPLRVIRERLARSGGDVPAAVATTVDLTEPAEVEVEAEAEQHAPEPAVVGARAAAAAPGPPPAPASAPAPAAPAPAPAPERREPEGVPAPALADGGGGAEVARTAEELAAVAGIDLDLLRELERFGLVSAKRVAGDLVYDRDAVDVATAAGGFARHGLEPRHLRAYLTAAAREAGLYEQLALPLARQRTPNARREAAARLDELVELGACLRTSLLRSSLREHFGPR
jgi:DNA-binding transcriptional MerR regulator